MTNSGLKRLAARASIRGRARRAMRLLQAGWAEVPSHPRPIPQRYFIKGGYIERLAPRHYVVSPDEAIRWQPDVYPDAAAIAQQLGSVRLVDLGCGDGEKLAELYPRFDIVGLDLARNVERCRDRFPFGAWSEHDLDSDETLPLSDDPLTGSVLICADVIEHLLRPERLLRKLRRALQDADAALISTPERNLTWGLRHFGPPPNPAHVREWALGEFGAFLAAEGFAHGSLGLTRSNDWLPHLSTILALVFPDERRSHAASAVWARVGTSRSQSSVSFNGAGSRHTASREVRIQQTRLDSMRFSRTRSSRSFR